MKNTYLKYIETVDVIPENPPKNPTFLQHVNVVAVVDELGNEWFPDASVPIEVDTPSAYDPSNVYKWGSVVKATTATFIGDDDIEPMSIWARWQFKLNGEDNFIDSERVGGLNNSPTEISFLIPEGTAEVKFFTSAKEQGDTPETQEFASSVLDVTNVIQPSVTVENTTGSPITTESGIRSKIEVRTTVNYEPEYCWQFEDASGSFRNASEGNLVKYYPDAVFTLFDGFLTPSFNFTWAVGSPAPTKFRCRVRDAYSDDGFVQEFTNEITINYIDPTPFDDQEFRVVEEASFVLDGEYEEGGTMSVDSFGINTHPSSVIGYYWMACDSSGDVNDLYSYKQRGSNSSYTLTDFDFLIDQTWRVLFFFETEECDSDGECKQLSYWTNPQSFN